MSAVSGQSVLLDIEELTADDEADETGSLTKAFNSADMYFELGQWLAGLESFCSLGNAMYLQGRERIDPGRKYLGEFSMCRSVLVRCAALINELRADKTTDPEFARTSLSEVERFIPDALVLNNALAQSQMSSYQEWNSWCKALAERLSRLKVVLDFENEFVRAGEFELPEELQALMLNEQLPNDDRRDLKRYLPRLGGILKSLQIIRRMLDRDQPIRPSLVIFSSIRETLDSLITDMNARLAVHPDESAEMFAITDAASYTLSIDRKKIYVQELAPILDLRSPIYAYARVESAYSVLNDNVRQLLAGFAQHFDSEASAGKMFPDFHEKLEQSIELRARLWIILKSVREAEEELSEERLVQLRSDLRVFLDGSVSFLFYKDRETFERFCNEIELTNTIEDVGPIVHRFSAYVETLLSLVKMRAVLANHPMHLAE